MCLDPWIQCYVGPRNDTMARPRVAVGGDGIEMWKMAANILNKRLWTAEKGWFSSAGLCEGLTHHRKEIACCKILHESSELDGFFGTT
jgi:hypothetical protein